MKRLNYKITMENENGEKLNSEQSELEELRNVKNQTTKKKKWTTGKILKMVVMVIVLAFVWIGAVQYFAADKYNAVVKVQEEGQGVGVNPTTEELDFGDLPKGDSLMRFVEIENGGEMDVYVKIVRIGSISDLIEINKNNFVLFSGDSAKIEFLLKMPISANKEEYKGKVIIFKLPKLF